MPIHQLIKQKECESTWQQSCDDALKHADETGLHATHDEVMAWMATWGTDEELPPPACHPPGNPACTSPSMTTYDELLRNKVEGARASMREGLGKSNDEVEAEFAARRARVADETPARPS